MELLVVSGPPEPPLVQELMKIMSGSWGSGDIGGPRPLDVLALQKPLQLFELFHRLVLYVGVWNLQADAVCGPAEFSREHLCQDPSHHWHHLRTTWTMLKLDYQNHVEIGRWKWFNSSFTSKNVNLCPICFQSLFIWLKPLLESQEVVGHD